MSTEFKATSSEVRCDVRARAASVLVVLGFSLPGCATIVHGRHQDVAVASSPPGARVLVEGSERGTTPTRLSLERKKLAIVLRFEKEGFRPAEVSLKRTTSGWIALDALAGASEFANQGLSSTGQQAAVAAGVAAFSFGIDFLTGGAYQLDPARVHVTLEPLVPQR